MDNMNLALIGVGAYVGYAMVGDILNVYSFVSETDNPWRNVGFAYGIGAFLLYQSGDQFKLPAKVRYFLVGIAAGIAYSAF